MRSLNGVKDSSLKLANGCTERLLMNLLLLRGGYPPLAVRPVDRNIYLDKLEHASMRQDPSPPRLLCMSDWTRPWGST
jgi:hypothetical protein